MRSVRRGFVLVVLLYLGLDFTHPSIPGAVSFNPDACTEGVRAERGRADVAVVPALSLVRHALVPRVVTVGPKRPRRDRPDPASAPRHRPFKRLAPHDRSAATDDH